MRPGTLSWKCTVFSCLAEQESLEIRESGKKERKVREKKRKRKRERERKSGVLAYGLISELISEVAGVAGVPGVPGMREKEILASERKKGEREGVFFPSLLFPFPIFLRGMFRQ